MGQGMGGGGGYTPDPVRPRNASGMGAGSGGDDLLGQVKAWSSTVEDVIETYTQVSRGFLLDVRCECEGKMAEERRTCMLKGDLSFCSVLGLA